MSLWIEIAGPGNHRVQVLDGGGILWEHDCPPGYMNGSYEIARHMVSPRHGATWQVVQAEPLTLSPSLHCMPGLGGCGAHGFITGGRWR